MIPAPPSQKLGLSRMLSSLGPISQHTCNSTCLVGSAAAGAQELLMGFPVPLSFFGSYFPPSLSSHPSARFFSVSPNIPVPPPSESFSHQLSVAPSAGQLGNEYRWRGAAPTGSKVTVTDTDTAVTEGAPSPLGHQLETYRLLRRWSALPGPAALED